MEIREGYKKTEVAVIPEEWEVKSLESLTPSNQKYGIVDGPFGSNLKTIHYRKSGIPIITSGYVTDGKFIASDYLYVDLEKFKQEKRSAVKPGDIVMAKIGARCGASAILPLDHQVGILSGNALKITVEENKYSSVYVWQILCDLYSRGCLESLRTTGAQPAISISNLKKLMISIPSRLTEQQAIATALSDMDGLISSLTKLIDKKKNVKQGAMQELLTGKKRLNGFSGEWVEDKLGDIAIIIMGQSPDSKYYNTGRVGLPLVQGNADIKNRKTVIRFYTSQITKTALKNDVIMTVRAPVGYIGKASDDCCIGRGVCAIRYENEYLYHYLIYIEDQWSKLSKGSTFDSVNSTEVKELILLIPPTIAEQIAIANILSDMDNEIEILQTMLNKYKTIKQGMMQELLTGRIRLVEEVKQ